tara:strand:+ start:366 stop:1355 length:990 start_codon:yes stop_codon:yes gene_type:complete
MLLKVENLHTHFISRDLKNNLRTAKALNGVSFDVKVGEIIGIVGETGAGKSLTAMSIMGLLQPPAKIVEGNIYFQGKNLAAMKENEINNIRGNNLSMIVQSPLTSLDPLSRIGKQLIRIQQEHQEINKSKAFITAVEMLKIVGIPDPERRMNAWPHELSGGMAQRILIAMALINKPSMLIADEPTTGLDVTVQAQILDLLKDLVKERRMASIIITHDLGVIAHYCSRMIVMFAGCIVETGTVESVFTNPSHPYTQALISSTPRKISEKGFSQVGGPPPNLYNLPIGCSYSDRCHLAKDICKNKPKLKNIKNDHDALCHFPNNSGMEFLK